MPLLMLASLTAKEILIIALLFIIPVLAITAIWRSNFDRKEKTLWIALVVVTTIIGAMIYFLMGRHNEKDNHPNLN